MDWPGVHIKHGGVQAIQAVYQLAFSLIKSNGLEGFALLAAGVGKIG